MPGAGSGHPPGKDLSSFSEIASEDLNILIIYKLNFFRTKPTKFSSLESLLLQLISFLRINSFSLN